MVEVEVPVGALDLEIAAAQRDGAGCAGGLGEGVVLKLGRNLRNTVRDIRGAEHGHRGGVHALPDDDEQGGAVVLAQRVDLGFAEAGGG